MSAKNVSMTDQRSHWVRLNRNGELEKEEIFVTFTAEWRGEPCVVRMTADRYRHSSGISEWRIYYPESGKYGNDIYAYNVRGLSDTARARISEIARPMLQAWIGTDEYRQSEKAALYACLKREVGDLKSHSEVRFLHNLVNLHADGLGYANTTRLKDAITAFAAFQSLYDAL